MYISKRFINFVCNIDGRRNIQKISSKSNVSWIYGFRIIQFLENNKLIMKSHKGTSVIPKFTFKGFTFAAACNTIKECLK